jgi:hypothetical protein
LKEKPYVFSMVMSQGSNVLTAVNLWQAAAAFPKAGAPASMGGAYSDA